MDFYKASLHFALPFLLMSLTVGPIKANPSLWEGQWEGSCTLTPSYNGISQFRGGLVVRAITESLPSEPNSDPAVKAQVKRYQWQLRYDFSGTESDVRDYELVVKGDQFFVDEKNGLMLDSYLVDNRLYTPFVIQGSMIMARYEFSVSEVQIEMPTYLQESVRKTCLNGRPDICVESLSLSRIQSCKFKKKVGGED